MVRTSCVIEGSTELPLITPPGAVRQYLQGAIQAMLTDLCFSKLEPTSRTEA
jgi:hypothetical protein